jgi:hypothetical protein
MPDKQLVTHYQLGGGEYASPAIDAFLAEIETVCRRHGFSIAHEDEHGAFIIEPFSKERADWLAGAHLDKRLGAGAAAISQAQHAGAIFELADGGPLDGWYFASSGSLHGPFETRQEADSALDTALREAHGCDPRVGT